MAQQAKQERAFLDTAIQRLKKAVTADQHNRIAGVEDLKFIHGDQWSDQEKQRRKMKGRPYLQINLLPKFVYQVVGDMLHNAPSIKVLPNDSQADVKIARVRAGIIKDIEYQSNAPSIYGYAAEQQVSSGYGAWRVLTRYVESNPFLQEIYLESIRNPFLVFMDPNSKDQNYADAQWGFVLEKIPKEDFSARFPNAKFTADAFKTGAGLANEHWYDGQTITVAEYFTKETEKTPMVQLDDGRVMTEAEYKILLKEWNRAAGEVEAMVAPDMLPDAASLVNTPTPAAPTPTPAPAPAAIPSVRAKQLGPKPVVAKRREADRTIVKHRIISSMEILDGGLEGRTVPGKFIPLVLIKGRELNIEGKNFVYSLVRHAKDPQKLVNYWNSAAAEAIALAPKAPFQATPKQIEGFEQDYAASNIDNFPVLLYNPDPEAPGMPQRTPPSAPPVAIFEQIRRGEENLKSVIGLFNADIGAPGSEQTGAAVMARQRPGDIGTFEFSVNLAQGIQHTGRIINSMIPEVYDTERDVRIRNIDDSDSFLPVNTTVGNALRTVTAQPAKYNGLDPSKLKQLSAAAGANAKFNDITKGEYAVTVTVGPSYATQRQESAQYLLQLTQSMPQQMALAADLIVENLGFKDSEELAARLRRMLPPGLAKPRQGDPPPAPPQPPPQVLLAQAKLQNEQAKQQLQQLKMQQEMIKLEHEKIKVQLELAKYQAAQGQQPDIAGMLERQVKLHQEDQRIQLELARFNHQRTLDWAEEGRKQHEQASHP